MEIRYDLQQGHRGAHEERVHDRTENAEKWNLSHLLNVAAIAELASTLDGLKVGRLGVLQAIRIAAVRIVFAV